MVIINREEIEKEGFSYNKNLSNSMQFYVKDTEWYLKIGVKLYRGRCSNIIEFRKLLKTINDNKQDIFSEE